MLRALFFFVVAVLASSCGTPPRSAYTIQIVDENGDDPIRAAGIHRGHVDVSVRQLDLTVVPDTADIVGMQLEDLEVGITSYGIITRIQVEVFDDEAPDRDSPVLIGATPPFVPLGYGFVRIVVGAPGTCALLSAPELSTDRVAPNLVAVESNLVSIGGEEAEGAPSDHVEVLSPVQLTYAATPLEFTPAPALPISAGDAVRLGTTTQLIVLDDARGVILYDLDPARTTQRDVAIAGAHAGAGPRSALVDLGTQGVVVIGGFSGDDPSREITWLDSFGNFSATTMLEVARDRPAAIRLGDHVLVAGGQAAGQPSFELISITSRTSESFGAQTDQRFDAVLARDMGASGRAWLGFGEDASGTLLSTALRIEGCPSACVAAPTADVERPRRGVRAVERTGETLVVGGADDTGPTDFVDRVRFASGSPIVEALGMLRSPRDRPGAAAIGSGIVIVGGGEGADALARSDLEICFPEALDEL